MPKTDINSGAGGGTEGTGSTDGDSSGRYDTLEFGVTLKDGGGNQPATALIGGAKSVAKDGTTGLSEAGVDSISILSDASAKTMLATGDFAVAMGHDVTAGEHSLAIGNGATAPHTITTANGGRIAIGRGATASGTLAAVAVGKWLLA